MIWFCALASPSHHGAQLYDECIMAMSMRRYDDLHQRGEQLYEAGVTDADANLQALGMAFSLRGKVSGHIAEDCSRTAAELDAIGARLYERGDSNSTVYYFVQSALSLYNLYDQLDYTLAVAKAYQSLKCAERMSDPDLETDALNILAAVYFLKGDTRGWEYALRSENLAKSTSNYSGMYTATVNMANYLFNRGEYDKALEYLLRGCELMRLGHLDVETVYVTSFMGDVYAHLNRNAEAEKCYREAINDRGSSPEYDRGYARMCYADFLRATGRFTEALYQLRKVEEALDSTNRPNYYAHLLFQTAYTYEQSDKAAEALDYYKRYMNEHGRLVTAEKEKALDALETRYKVAEARNHNMQQALELAEKNRRLILLWCIIAGLVAVSLLLWLLNRRTRLYYRRVVATTLENLEKQKLLQQQLKAALDSRSEDMRKAPDGRKGDELFTKVKELMEEEHVYRNPDLSIESLAHMAGTNRTYLSRLINERTGVSYANFVNDYRLDEIILALSDPSNTASIKSISIEAGFATMANFYNLFKQRVGISPAMFRKNALASENAGTELVTEEDSSELPYND